MSEIPNSSTWEMLGSRVYSVQHTLVDMNNSYSDDYDDDLSARPLLPVNEDNGDFFALCYDFKIIRRAKENPTARRPQPNLLDLAAVLLETLRILFLDLLDLAAVLVHIYQEIRKHVFAFHSNLFICRIVQEACLGIIISSDKFRQYGEHAKDVFRRVKHEFLYEKLYIIRRHVAGEMAGL